MLSLSLTFLGFTMLYNASPKRAMLALPGLDPRRSGGWSRVLGLAALALAALAWCRLLGVTGGLIAWLAAASALGTLVILAAPVAPRRVVAAAALALGAALVGGLQAWLP